MIKGIRNLVVTRKRTCTILGILLILVVSTLLSIQLYSKAKVNIEPNSEQQVMNVGKPVTPLSNQVPQVSLIEISQKEDVSIYVPPKESEGEAEKSGEDEVPYLDQIPLSKELQQLIYNRCQEEKLDYHLVLGLIWRESRFDVNALGYNNNGTVDTGLMQINDVNHKFLRETYGINNLLDPEQNILAGTALLGDWAEKHGQHYAIMAYRSGEYGMLSKTARGITTDWSVEIVYEKGEEYLELIEDAKDK